MLKIYSSTKFAQNICSVLKSSALDFKFLGKSLKTTSMVGMGWVWKSDRPVFGLTKSGLKFDSALISCVALGFCLGLNVFTYEAERIASPRCLDAWNIDTQDMIDSFSFQPKPSLDRLGDTSQQGTGLWPEELVYAGAPISGAQRSGAKSHLEDGQGVGTDTWVHKANKLGTQWPERGPPWSVPLSNELEAKGSQVRGGKDFGDRKLSRTAWAKVEGYLLDFNHQSPLRNGLHIEPHLWFILAARAWK